MTLRYPNIIIFFASLLLTVSGCGQKGQKKALPWDEGLFRDYCLMNATETFDFTLPASLTVQDLNGRHIRMDSLALEDKMILRIRSNFCDDCIQKEIHQIDSLKDKSHVAIIATYNNLRVLKMAANKFNIKVPIYNLSNAIGDDFLGRNDSKGIPYLFILRNNLHCESVFFPSKLFPSFSADYYKLVTKNLQTESTELGIFRFPDADLGKVQPGKVYDVEFTYTNHRSEPLVIRDVRTSCGCVVPEWHGKPLKMGESAVLKVRFTPKGYGYNMQSIMIFHNQSRYPTRLTVKAEVVTED